MKRVERKVIVHHHSFELAEAKGLASSKKHMFPYTDVMGSMFERHVDAIQVLWNTKCYERVAQFIYPHCSVNDPINELLEDAWTNTQNIYSPWPLAISNEEFLIEDPQRRAAHVCRSSMVGDIFELVDEHGMSTLWRVDGIGFKPFKELSNEQVRQLETNAGLDAE